MRKLLLSLLAAIALASCTPTKIVEDNVDGMIDDNIDVEVNKENLAGVWQMEKISLAYEGASGSEIHEAVGENAGYDTIIFNTDGSGYEYENGISISFRYDIIKNGKGLAITINSFILYTGSIPLSKGGMNVDIISLSKTSLVMSSQIESEGQALTQTITMRRIHDEVISSQDLLGSWEDAQGTILEFKEDGTFTSLSGDVSCGYEIDGNKITLTNTAAPASATFTIALYDNAHMEMWDTSHATRFLRVGSDSKKPWFQTPGDQIIRLEGISLDKPGVELKVGNKETLSVIFHPEEVTQKPEVRWSSENPGVATVSNGVVTAVSAGETVITATAGGYTAKSTVAVVPAEEITMDVAIDGDFSEWDKITVLTADARRYIYSELKDPELNSLLRLKLASDKDYIYVYTEIRYKDIYVADGGPYSQGDSMNGFLPNHPGTPGPLTVYLGSDNDSTGAFASMVDDSGNTFWDYNGFDSVHSYSFLWDSAASRMQFGWNTNYWPQNRDNWEEWMWGEPYYSIGDAFWLDGVHGTPDWDNTVSDENTFRFSGVTTVKDPLNNADIDAIKVEFSMDRNKLNEDGTEVSGNAFIGIMYENKGHMPTGFQDVTGKLPSSGRVVTLDL